MNNTQVANQHFIEEDEIDLRELWQTVLKGKKIIALITMVVVFLTLLYVLSIPNVYKSAAVLIPSSEDKSQSLGGLSGLAAMAGVSLGGASSMTPDVAFNALLSNYDFMKTFIKENKIDEYYKSETADNNYVFALGFRGIYNLFKSTPSDDKKQDHEKEIYDLTKKLSSNFSINADKKSGLITVAYSDEDRIYAPKMVNLFLQDASKYLVKNNLDNINKRLSYFEKEMAQTEGFELRQSLSGIISKIVQEKVMMQSKQYYQCDLLTAAQEPYIANKIKPKRALILVVSFITSIILGVFLVFFLNFIREEKADS